MQDRVLNDAKKIMLAALLATAIVLPAQAQKNKVMARQDGVDHLGHHRVFISYDAGKELSPALNPADQVLAKFIFDAATHQFRLRKGTGAKRTEGMGQILRELGQVIPPLFRYGSRRCTDDA